MVKVPIDLSIFEKKTKPNFVHVLLFKSFLISIHYMESAFPLLLLRSKLFLGAHVQ